MEISLHRKDKEEKSFKINVLRSREATRRICTCREARYIIDKNNLTVECDICGAYVEPFIALEKLCDNWETVNHELELAHKEKKELQEYKPHLRAVKLIERRIRQGRYKTSPVCPKCNEIIELEDIASGTWKDKTFSKSFWEKR